MKTWGSIAVAAALVAAPARADDAKKIELGGRIATYIRAPISRVDRPLQQLSTSAWLDLNARMTKGTYAKAQLAGHLLTPSIDDQVEARADLREAFAAAHDGGLEVRIGQQIIAWGNADVVNAVDLLGARDYTFFSAVPDAQRIGAPSVMATYAPDADTSPLRVTLVWQPVFPASRMLVPKGLLPPGVVLLPATRPTPSLAASEIGVKIGWAPGGWDVALVAFRGYNHVAEPFVASVSPSRIEIGRTYHGYIAGGLEASYAAGDWVLRFEGAYVATENGDGLNPRIQPTHVDAIAGVERPFGERVRASAQAIVRAHPLWMSPTAIGGLDGAVAKVNAVMLNYTHVVRPGGTLRISYTSEDESLEIGAAGMAYAVGFDWAVQPEITYRPIEPLKLTAGVQVFGGQPNSLGALEPYSGVFAQSTYAF